MFKNILMGILGAVVVVAIAVSAYTVFASPDTSINVAGGNGNGKDSQGQSNGSGIPQANVTGATTIHGTVVSADLMGMTITTDDGQTLYMQLGQSRYSQSIGFYPQVGEDITVYGFTGDQGLFTAIRVTMDSTGQVFTFRSETGQPLWAGGNGNGKGNGGRP
jgi:hypothetical protein